MNYHFKFFFFAELSLQEYFQAHLFVCAKPLNMKIHFPDLQMLSHLSTMSLVSSSLLKLALGTKFHLLLWHKASKIPYPFLFRSIFLCILSDQEVFLLYLIRLQYIYKIARLAR